MFIINSKLVKPGDMVISLDIIYLYVLDEKFCSVEGLVVPEGETLIYLGLKEDYNHEYRFFLWRGQVIGGGFTKAAGFKWDALLSRLEEA